MCFVIKLVVLVIMIGEVVLILKFILFLFFELMNSYLFCKIN